MLVSLAGLFVFGSSFVLIEPRTVSHSKRSEEQTGYEINEYYGNDEIDDVRDMPFPVNRRSNIEQRIAHRIFVGYDKLKRPRGTNESNPNQGGPVNVILQLDIKFLNSISDINMEFGCQFLFQQEWLDTRLRFDHMRVPEEIEWISLSEDQIKKLWVPDAFFPAEKKGHYHVFDKPNEYTRVRRDGWIVYNRRLSITFACVMHLRKYPHDAPVCVIDYSIFAHTTEDIQAEWHSHPIKMSPGIMLPKLILKSVTNTTCDRKSASTGIEYSCLRVELKFARVFSFFVLQLYIPSILLVSVSSVSFWIDWKSAPGRVPLSIVTLLTMITQQHSINAMLPPVSYTKAVDVWLGSCIIFIFCTLLEYAAVNYVGLREDKYRQAQREKAARRWQLETGREALPPLRLAHNGSPYRNPLLRYDGATDALLANHQNEATAVDNMRYANYIGEYADELKLARLRRRRRSRMIWTRFSEYLERKGRAERIDFVSRAIFPLSFVCFNCAYWYVYW